MKIVLLSRHFLLVKPMQFQNERELNTSLLFDCDRNISIVFIKQLNMCWTLHSFRREECFSGEEEVKTSIKPVCCYCLFGQNICNSKKCRPRQLGSLWPRGCEVQHYEDLPCKTRVVTDFADKHHKRPTRFFPFKRPVIYCSLQYVLRPSLTFERVSTMYCTADFNSSALKKAEGREQ